MTNPDVDAYIERSEKWPDEMAELRPILLSCGLTEEIKWRQPCYTHEGKNIVILQEMKDFLALMFFKGAYNLYFSDAKQAKTRLARVEKYAEKILAGKGLRER